MTLLFGDLCPFQTLRELPRRISSCPFRNPAHQMIAPPRLELPLLSHFARSMSHHELSRNDIFTACWPKFKVRLLERAKLDTLSSRKGRGAELIFRQYPIGQAITLPNLLFSDYASMLRCRAWSEPMSQKDARHNGIRRIGTLLEDVEAAVSRRPPSSRPTAGSPRSSTQAGTRRSARRGTAASTSRSTERGGRT